ncbi:MAG TPA: hypothetical protein VGR89_00435 [Puia sp.]|nr:hypothetical protein [Puia sp.]
MSNWSAATALAFAVGAVAYIISRSEMGEKVIRSRIAWQHTRHAPDSRAARFWEWMLNLTACPFCTGTWLSLFGTAVYRPLLVHEWWPLDYLVTALAVDAIAMATVVIIKNAIKR